MFTLTNEELLVSKALKTQGCQEKESINGVQRPITMLYKTLKCHGIGSTLLVTYLPACHETIQYTSLGRMLLKSKRVQNIETCSKEILE